MGDGEDLEDCFEVLVSAICPTVDYLMSRNRINHLQERQFEKITIYHPQLPVATCFLLVAKGCEKAR